ncbi:hypothetical protein ACFXBB_23810 [Streptomyces scopuliridis]
MGLIEHHLTAGHVNRIAACLLVGRRTGLLRQLRRVRLQDIRRLAGRSGTVPRPAGRPSTAVLPVEPSVVAAVAAHDRLDAVVDVQVGALVGLGAEADGVGQVLADVLADVVVALDQLPDQPSMVEPRTAVRESFPFARPWWPLALPILPAARVFIDTCTFASFPPVLEWASWSMPRLPPSPPPPRAG